MSTPQTILEWLATANGVAMNPDRRYGLQCVDLVDQYAQDIFGVPWPQCVGGVSGARQLLDVAPDAYWIRTDNSPDPNVIPSKGDVVVFAGSAINEWGHTAVVDSADTKGMWVIQQDGFAAPLVWVDGSWYSNKPAHRIWLPYYSNGTGPLSGWLTPRANKLASPSFVVTPASSVTPITANQRKTANALVNIRTAPTSSSDLLGTIPPNTVQTFVGWVVGEMIDNFNVWYKGTDGYVWCGGFTEKKIDGLPNLTNQRRTGSGVVNIRKEPSSTSAIIGQIPPNTDQLFTGYAVGEMIDNFNVWYKGTDGYAWCGGFTTQVMYGLENVTPIYAPPAPAPTDPANVAVPAYTFSRDFDFVEYKPAHITNVQAAYDNPGITVFPPKPEKTIIHQFDARAKNPSLDGVTNHFATERPGSESSAHFSVSGQRIVQHVSLKDRAYHAGKVGNNYIGIETDPQQDAETIASTKKLLKALKEKYGYEFTLTLHKDVPGNSTNCGVEINLSDYKLEVPAPVPVPTPTPVPPPAPTPVPEPQPVPIPSVSEEAVIDDFLASLKKLYFDSK